MRVFYVKKSILVILAFLIVFWLSYCSGRLLNENMLPAIGALSKERPIFSVKKNVVEACLTFDISWGNKTLPLVLKVLHDNQVPATFFLSGPWAVKHPAEVKAIFDGGYEIASHGDRHINLSQYPQEVVKENISKSYQDLMAVTAKVAPFFRPPNGDYNDMVINTARELGFETVIWAVDSLDWKNPGPDFMIKRVLTRVFPGAIILCHASDSSKEIHLALPWIIKGLRKKGYRLVTLSKLVEGGVVQRNDPR